MPLIKVVNKKVASLPYLNILALRNIYEKHTLTKEETELMMSSVINWSKKSNLSDDEKTYLCYICTLLDREEKGKYKERLETFKRLNIDWRKFHGIIKRIGNGRIN